MEVCALLRLLRWRERGLNRHVRRFGLRSATLARLGAMSLAVCLIASGCAGAPQASDVRVFLDGKAWDGAPISPAGGDGLRVYITYDGQPLLDVPFGERRSVRILQADGSENTVAITGDAVYMEHANCENQDCVQMGAVTRDNLELRVMGGFIVCLPHRISVEVRGE